MQISNLPATKLAIPFASSAGGGYIRTIPQASQIGISDGAASLTDGFVPLNFQPVGSGGVPPDGRDMNGILFEMSAWTRWQNAGGLVPYDSAFSTAIGGYPQSALLAGTALGTIFLSTADNNTTNPNSGGAGWVPLATGATVQSGQYVYAAAGGTANALTATLSPAPAALTAGQTVTILAAADCTTAATLNLNGLGAKSIVRANLAATQKGDILAGQELSLTYNGTSWQINNPGTGTRFQYQWVQSVAGTYTFTAPYSGWFYVKVTGAGGSGGAYMNLTAIAACGGGGGVAEGFVYLTAGQTVIATVGAGGAGVTGNAAGNAGGTSSFGSFMSATGGGGGNGGVSINGAGGPSGVGTGGTINYGLGAGSCFTACNGTSFDAGGLGGGPGGPAGSGSGGASPPAAGTGPGGGGGGTGQGNTGSISGVGSAGSIIVTG